MFIGFYTSSSPYVLEVLQTKFARGRNRESKDFESFDSTVWSGGMLDSRVRLRTGTTNSVDAYAQVAGVGQ